MTGTFRIGGHEDLEQLAGLVAQYHRFESIESTAGGRAAVLAPLLQKAGPFGFIALAETETGLAGYLAVCYGYSIEFGGRDAFIDELYVAQDQRGQGIGSGLMTFARQRAANDGVRGWHLEVATDNEGARRFYRRLGFSARERFHLMSCKL